MATSVQESSMEYDESDVGVNLLESITLGLYRFPFNAVREYIQNEVDSTPRPDRIEIKISGRDVFIIGDGSGMNWNDVLEAKKVGISAKNPETDAGFRGIGIFSGIAVCREVVIDTRKRRSEERIILRFDGDGLRKKILNHSNTPLLQALREHVSYERHKTDKDDQTFGTTVCLHDVLPEHSTLLDPQKLREYLELTAPTDFYQNFVFREKVNRFLDQNVPGYKNFKIELNGKEVRRRPDLPKERIREPYEYIFKNGKDVKAVWWVCPSSQRSIDQPGNRNFVYKCKGLTVGGRDALSSLIETNKNLLDWMVGEIHVVDPGVKPNAERMAFEPSKARDDLEDWVKQTWLDKAKDIPRQISAENVTNGRLKESEAIMEEGFTKINEEDEWLSYLTSLKKLIDDLERDSKDHFLSGRMKDKAKERARKLLYYRKNAQEKYDHWKASQLSVKQSGTAAKTTVALQGSHAIEATLQGTQGGTKPEAIVSTFEFRPDTELLDSVETVIQSLIARLELQPLQASVVTASVTALSTMPVSVDFLRDFLIRLEYALNETA